MNAARPSLARSIPFWGLLVLSLATIAVGAWIALSQISTMNTALAANTATGVEVYGGQSMAVVGSIVLGAGIVGLLLTLAVASARALVPVAAVEVVEPAAYDVPSVEDAPAQDVAAQPVPTADTAHAPAVTDTEAEPALR